MRTPFARVGLLAVFALGTAFLASQVDSQELVGQPKQAAPEAAPEVPKGIEVMARGPVHEAYASPNHEPKATPAIPKKPPAPMEEMPPEERPEGDVVWIGGYWAYDDERKDFLWVSGCWRVKPEGKEWVPGYWRDVDNQSQWVPGFWTSAAPQSPGKVQEVTYYPAPPAPPNVAPPGDPPAADMFYVPGYWQWSGTHYVWRAGYWMRVRSGLVYIPAHYRWTPTGYVFITGYWDYALPRRGVIYAPVVVSADVVPATYVYTPAYAVADTLVLDAMFVRPAYGCYYFGDYYGPAYADRGFVTTVVYSRTYYEPIVVYQRWEYRENPRWFEVQINLVFDRNAGRAPVPPRTLVQQNTIIQNNTTVNNYFVNNNSTTVNNTTVNNNTTVQKPLALQPAKTYMTSKNIPTTKLDTATRTQIKQTSQAVQVAAATERKKTELAPIAPGAAGKPRTASLSVPTTPVAPKSPYAAGTTANNTGGVPAKLGSGVTNPNPQHVGGSTGLGAPPPNTGKGTTTTTTTGPTGTGVGTGKGTPITDPKYTPPVKDSKTGTTINPKTGPTFQPFDPLRPPPKKDDKKKDR